MICVLWQNEKVQDPGATDLFQILTALLNRSAVLSTVKQLIVTVTALPHRLLDLMSMCPNT